MLRSAVMEELRALPGVSLLPLPRAISLCLPWGSAHTWSPGLPPLPTSTRSWLSALLCLLPVRVSLRLRLHCLWPVIPCSTGPLFTHSGPRVSVFPLGTPGEPPSVVRGVTGCRRGHQCVREGHHSSTLALLAFSLCSCLETHSGA